MSIVKTLPIQQNQPTEPKPYATLTTLLIFQTLSKKKEQKNRKDVSRHHHQIQMPTHRKLICPLPKLLRQTPHPEKEARLLQIPLLHSRFKTKTLPRRTRGKESQGPLHALPHRHCAPARSTGQNGRTTLHLSPRIQALQPHCRSQR